MGKHRCKDCFFWERDEREHGTATGDCRRHAPQAANNTDRVLVQYLSQMAWDAAPNDAVASDYNLHENNGGISRWPVTIGDLDWCGDFEPVPRISTF